MEHRLYVKKGVIEREARNMQQGIGASLWHEIGADTVGIKRAGFTWFK